MAMVKYISRFPQFAKANQRKVRAALWAVAPIIEKQILKTISKTPGGHLHDSGDTLRKTKVIPVSGANPRIEVRTTQQGAYQDIGFTHWLSGEFIQNQFISPVIRKDRISILKFIANHMRKSK